MACAPEALGPRSELPWDGAQRALVVPLAFTDAPPPLSTRAVRDAFFGDRSLAAWLAEGSHGATALTGDVLSWRVAQSRWADVPDATAVLTQAEVVFADAIGDPGPYDADGNGRIDHLFVLHAGRIGEDRPRPSALFVEGPADHTVVLQAAGVGGVGDAVPIGLYLHEAGHRYFDLPDRYGDHLHGDYGIGVWGLMGLGQWGPSSQIPTSDLFRFPVHFRASAAERVGWVSPRVVTSAGEVRLEPIETTGDAVRIPGDPELWLEVRSPTGFSDGLPGHGLLVWQEGVDADGGSAWTRLVQADGRDDLAHGADLGERPLPPTSENLGDASDPFPGADGVTSWTDPRTGTVLRDIRQDGDAVILTVEPG